jgi:hypothetical protein
MKTIVTDIGAQLLKEEAAKLFTRPFNLEHAKAGAPYACLDGRKAEIIKWDLQGFGPLLGFVRCPESGEDIAVRWLDDGTTRGAQAGPGDLVMTPIGYIDGRPVFVGDEIVSERTGRKHTIRPCDHHLAGFRWPEPEKRYPVTRLTGAELGRIYDGDDSATADWTNRGMDCLTAVANAALRHAVDSGQVVTAEQVNDEVRALGERMAERRAARDMAVAEAVRDWYVKEASDAPNLPTFCNIMSMRDLAAIIAKVTA